MLVSDWADTYRILSPESAAQPGQWVTDRIPYGRAIQNAVNDPATEEVVLCKSAQVGGTELTNNIIGYHIHQHPSPILVVQPTIEVIELYSREKLAPMLRDTPVLCGLVQDPRSRDSGNTVKAKKFPGGQISMAGANSPASLRSRAVRLLVCDEVDAWPRTAGVDGDPLALAVKRTTTFPDRKIVYVSTPLIKGMSRIEDLYQRSDRRRYHVPCPHCGEFQVLKWEQVHWERDDAGQALPETAVYECEHCQATIEHHHKPAMIAAGRWIAEAPFAGRAGFHINELYSPFSTWAKMVEDFVVAQGNPERLKTFVNLSLGESWDVNRDVEEIDVSEFAARREEYSHEVPAGVQVLTLGADVQDDRLEAEVLGWNRDKESWSVEYFVFPGNPAILKSADPAFPSVWEQLLQVIQRRWQGDGRTFRIAVTTIDTGGHHTQTVYEFIRKYAHLGIKACKGASTPGKPIVSRPTRVGKHKTPLHLIGTENAKEQFYNRLKLTPGTPGSYHFPAHYDDEYFRQLHAERATLKVVKGVLHKVYVKRRQRNEALDCRVLNIAAFELLPRNWRALEQPSVTEPPPDTPLPPPAAIRRPARPPRRGGWATGWKKK